MCPTGLSIFPTGTWPTRRTRKSAGPRARSGDRRHVYAQTGYANWRIQAEGYDFTARTNFDLALPLRNQLMVGYVADQHTNDNPSYVGQPGARIRAGLQTCGR